jgi:hypothetical protein
MMSLMVALSVGSTVQNIAFFLFLSLLVYANYCLIEANSDKMPNAPDIPERKTTDNVFDSILSGLTLYRRINRRARLL